MSKRPLLTSCKQSTLVFEPLAKKPRVDETAESNGQSPSGLKRPYSEISQDMEPGPQQQTPAGRRESSLPIGLHRPNSTSLLSTRSQSIGAPGAAPRKMVIKPFSVSPQLPKNFLEDVWEKLAMAVAAVQGKRTIEYSKEELFRAVEDTCVHKLSADIYARLQRCCDDHIAASVAALQSNCSPDSAVFLGTVRELWDDHSVSMRTIRTIFLVLDRNYVMTSQPDGMRSLWDMGLCLFRKHLNANREVQDRIIKSLLTLIHKERDREVADRGLIKSVLSMLSLLQAYRELFEPPLLVASSEYYQLESLRCVAQFDVPTYLTHCEDRLNDELDRVNHCFEAATRIPLLQVVEKQLLSEHAPSLLERGFAQLLREHRESDIARVARLYTRISALPLVLTHFTKYIKDTGLAVIMDEEKDKDMVQTLLDLREYCQRVLVVAFNNNETFSAAIQSSFEDFINKRQNRPAELIAKFVDANMRVGNKKRISDMELEALLDKTMALFRCIRGKDVFEAFYKKDLAKRLLLGKSASSDAERAMISKLKSECGATFTSKLEGMFKDMEASVEFVESFKQTAAHRELPFSLDVQILTKSFWPVYAPSDLILPRDVCLAHETFAKHYHEKFSGRQLTWQHSLAQCRLKATFPEGHKELVVSAHQAVVLLLFNEAESLSFSDIKTLTGIESGELKRTLQELACVRIKNKRSNVLVKTPQSKQVNDSDMFSFNSAFSSRKKCVVINQLQARETVEEQKQTTDRVFQDRTYEIDAAVVRIMKTRKTLSHQLLMGELLQQLPFQPKPQDLKKRIESLIERDYLERRPDDPSSYNYVA
eukprot:gnl/Spiro4/27653_TR13774_c0_g1_i1.p1 gnl/Spiro4/27653_TR13774_c0_g1~~gnl/Spiro4/27653_TR13774_c0_g1_i1.p1  ORF type:complete len:821 (+),score=188.64 gnl/Spiro4/27653_TR13774_c0_g1_i1:80-2542(+)